VVFVDKVVWIPVDVRDAVGATDKEKDVVAGIETTVTLETIDLVETGTLDDKNGPVGTGESSRNMPKKSRGDSKRLVKILPAKSSFCILVAL
jgi:hypothetical protein